MSSVQTWSGAQAKQLRAALRMTVRGFAEYLGVSTRTVANWEARGEAVEPRPEFQAVLDTALAKASAEQQERFAAAVRSAPDPGGEDTTDRRQLLISAFAAGGMALGPVRISTPFLSRGQLHDVVRSVDEARGHDERDLVAHFERSLAGCHGDDGQRGPEDALPSTLSLLAAIDITTRQVSARTRPHVLGVAARCAEFVGWLYRDAGAPEWATYWRDRAMESAQEAGDGPMQGYILLKKSQLAWDTRDGFRMLTLAQAAQNGPWQLPRRVMAEAVQQEARGWAMTGGSSEVVERKLAVAQDLLFDGAESTNADQDLGGSYDLALLRVQAALCHAALGAAAKAVGILQDVLARRPFSRRDHGYFTSFLASSLAAAGAVDEAATAGLEAHEIAKQTRSVRTLRELDRLLTQLRPWAERPSVRELQLALAG